MVKRQKKVVAKKHQVQNEKQVDRWTQIVQRTLQGMALLLVGILLSLRGTVNDFRVEDYVIIALLGLAVGLNPDQIRQMFTDIVKAFIGRKS